MTLPAIVRDQVLAATLLMRASALLQRANAHRITKAYTSAWL